MPKQERGSVHIARRMSEHLEIESTLTPRLISLWGPTCTACWSAWSECTVLSFRFDACVPHHSWGATGGGGRGERGAHECHFVTLTVPTTMSKERGVSLTRVKFIDTNILSIVCIYNTSHQAPQPLLEVHQTLATWPALLPNKHRHEYSWRSDLHDSERIFIHSHTSCICTALSTTSHTHS